MRRRDHSCIDKRFRNFQLLSDFAKLRRECHLAGRELVAVFVARNLVAYENHHARYVTQAAARQHGDERNVRLGVRFSRNKASQSFDEYFLHVTLAGLLLFTEPEEGIGVRSYVVVRFFQFESCGFNGLFEFFVAVHFAVAVGDAGEVERCRLERVGCGFEALLVPKRFEYIDVCFRSRGLVNLCQNFCDLPERKTVQELTHPDGVCSLWEFCRIVQNVAGNGVDAVGEACIGGVLFGDCGLPRKVDDGYLHVLVVLAAGDGPLGRVSANVEKLRVFQFCKLFEHNRECFGKRQVGVKVVKAEPAFFLLLREL